MFLGVFLVERLTPSIERGYMPFKGPYVYLDNNNGTHIEISLQGHHFSTEPQDEMKPEDLREALRLMVGEYRRIASSGYTLSPPPDYIWPHTTCSVCREELRFCEQIWWMYMQPVCIRCYPLRARAKRSKE